MAINITSILEGKKFIEEEDRKGNTRICKKCSYGTTKIKSRIEYTGCESSRARRFFERRIIPDTIDEKQTGNYCPYFDNFSLNKDL